MARKSRLSATTCRSGRAAEKEFGTYFIGYARSPRTIEQMLENMFVGKPPGNYDRLLDFSVAKTGNLFFVHQRLSWRISQTTIRLRDFHTRLPLKRQSRRRNARVRSRLVRLKETLPHE